MSLYRAKDELTRQAIHLILSNLGEQGRLSTQQITQQVAADLPRRLQGQLRQKGGEAELKRLLQYLRSRGYISLVYGRGQRAIYHLSTTGWRRLEELQYVPLEERAKKWDGKWRVLVFDIPEDQRPARDALRRVIKQLGFVPLQRSVWIQPLPCEEEIAEIKRAYGLDDSNLTLLLVEDFNGEEEYIKIFATKLKGSK